VQLADLEAEAVDPMSMAANCPGQRGALSPSAAGATEDAEIMAGIVAANRVPAMSCGQSEQGSRVRPPRMRALPSP
jgi:hypothetical protein